MDVCSEGVKWHCLLNTQGLKMATGAQLIHLNRSMALASPRPKMFPIRVAAWCAAWEKAWDESDGSKQALDVMKPLNLCGEGLVHLTSARAWPFPSIRYPPSEWQLGVL